MDKYLISIVTVSICIGIYNIVVPQFHGIEKYTKAIGMLVVICIIISPFKELIKAFDENGFENIKESIGDYDNGGSDEYNEIFKEYLNSFSIEEIKNDIYYVLYEKFEISNNDSEIEIFTDFVDGNLTISKIQILLKGKAIFKNPYKIEEYFENQLSCDCQVLIK